MDGWMVSQRLKKVSGDVPQTAGGLTLSRSQVLVEGSADACVFFRFG